MQKDIKNLQEIINLSKEEIKNNNENITAILDLEDLKSLENLLIRYKQPEEKNKDIVEKLYTERMANKVMSNNIIGYQEELEKKEAVINEMAIILSSICTGIEVIRKQFEKEYCEFINGDEDCCWKTDKECSDCIIEYFTNKVEREGK